MTEWERISLWGAFDKFIRKFRPVVVDLLKSNGYSNWLDEFGYSLQGKKKSNWNKARKLCGADPPIDLIDYPYLKSFAIGKQNLLKSVFKEDAENVPSWFGELYLVRNKLSHFGTPPSKNACDKAWIHLEILSERLSYWMKDKNFLSEIKDLRAGKVSEEVKQKLFQDFNQQVKGEKIRMRYMIGGLLIVVVSLIAYLLLQNQKTNFADNNSVKTNPPPLVPNKMDSAQFRQPSSGKKAPTVPDQSPNGTVNKTPQVLRKSSQVSANTEDYSAYVNTPAKKLGVMITIIDKYGNILPFLSSDIAKVYKENGYESGTGLLKNNFTKSMKFEDLIEGNTELMKNLGLNNYADYIVLGRTSDTSYPNSEVSNSIINSISLSVSVISTQDNSVNNFKLPDCNGNGKTAALAKEDARNRLLRYYYQNYSTLK